MHFQTSSGGREAAGTAQGRVHPTPFGTTACARQKCTVVPGHRLGSPHALSPSQRPHSTTGITIMGAVPQNPGTRYVPRRQFAEHHILRSLFCPWPWSTARPHSAPAARALRRLRPRQPPRSRTRPSCRGPGSRRKAQHMDRAPRRLAAASTSRAGSAKRPVATSHPNAPTKNRRPATVDQ